MESTSNEINLKKVKERQEFLEASKKFAEGKKTKELTELSYIEPKEDEVPKENLALRIKDPQMPMEDNAETIHYDPLEFYFDKKFMNFCLNIMQSTAGDTEKFDALKCLSGELIPNKNNIIKEDDLAKFVQQCNDFLTEKGKEKKFFKGKLTVAVFDHLLCLLPLASFKPDVCSAMAYIIWNIPEDGLLKIYYDPQRIFVLKECKASCLDVEILSDGDIKIDNWLKIVFEAFIHRLKEIFPLSDLNGLGK